MGRGAASTPGGGACGCGGSGAGASGLGPEDFGNGPILNGAWGIFGHAEGRPNGLSSSVGGISSGPMAADLAASVAPH